jgi:hypothetical protein
VGAIAAVRLVVSGEGKVEVWVADRVTGKAVVRELDALEAHASDDTVALGAVELLRASLMEIHSAEPPRGDVPLTPTVAALALPGTAEPWTPRLGVAVEAATELGVRGLGPTGDARLEFWARLTPHVGVTVLGQVGVAPARVTTSAGTAAVSADLAGVMLTYTLTDPSSAWTPSVSVGGAAARVTSDGTGTPPFVGASSSTWLFAPVVGSGLGWAFTRGLRLRGDGEVGWATPSVEVHTPLSVIGRWGAPLLLVSCGVEVLWGR